MAQRKEAEKQREQEEEEEAVEATKGELEELGQQLLDTIDHTLASTSIHGLDKLRKRVSAELDFLGSLSQPSGVCSAKDRARVAAKLSSTNLPHLRELVYRARDKQQNATAVLSKIRARTADGRIREAVVDIVADQGRRWIKITARKPLALQQIWEGRASFNKRSIVHQVKELQELAQLRPVGSVYPSVSVVFSAGVTLPMAEHLEGMGVSVEGAAVPYTPTPAPEDEESSSGLERRKGNVTQESEVDRPREMEQARVPGSSAIAANNRSHTSGDHQHEQMSEESGNNAVDGQVWAAYRRACAVCAAAPDSDVYGQMKRFLHTCTRSRVDLQAGLASTDTSCHDSSSSSDSSSSGSDTCERENAMLLEHRLRRGSEASKLQQWLSDMASRPAHCINLDVSSLVLLSSDVSYGLTAPSQLCDPLLVAMAEEEETNPALPRVLRALWNRHLLVCETAFRGFRSIVETIAGPREKQRAQALLERCCVMEDLSSPTLDRLPLSGKVKRRTKTIFNHGAALGIPTLTANSAFLRSANQYGVHVLVEVHAGRALTETQVDRWIRCGKPPRVNTEFYHRRARELEAARPPGQDRDASNQAVPRE